jgi:hypothetical protein
MDNWNERGSEEEVYVYVYTYIRMYGLQGGPLGALSREAKFKQDAKV